ncbi:hypothetical protein PHET_03735, partial [Paragonimus heterotremus]
CWINVHSGCSILQSYLLQELGEKWDRFESGNHVIIHIPSVGYSEPLRRMLRDASELEHMESRQIARICEIRKSTTDVIYISRGLISEDLLEYYDKLLGLTGAIRTGNSADQKSTKTRFRILVPEAVDDFRSSTTPPLCLSTLLKYSPRALRHIRNFIAGRPALIVPGVGGHPDDFAVGDALGIPVFGSSPAVTNLFLLQSTSRRMVAQLAEADANNEEEGEPSRHPVGNVLSPRTSVLLTTVLRKTSTIAKERRHKLSEVARSRTSRISLSPRLDFDLCNQPRREVLQPPGDFDMYTLDKLYETLAELFAEHLPTRLWLLKIDTGVSGYGTARLNLDHLRSFTWAKEQRMWYGPSRWAKKWAQASLHDEATYLRLLTEVPELVKNHLEILDSKLYPDAESFLDAMIAEGGVIEACPPVDEWTNLFVNMVILPNGQVQLLASGDQLHGGNMVSSWGATIPMLSVDPVWVNAVSYRLAKAMVRKGFIGHFKIDYVTFINPDNDQQVLWVTGIRQGYADSLAMLQLTLFAASAAFEVNRVTGAHYIQSQVTRPLLSEGEFDRACETNPRFAVISSHLWHTNLSMLQYSVFFQICRAQYIGYNLKERRGILFTPMDSYKREYLGMMAIAESLEKAIQLFVRSLRLIHKEISTPNMPGSNNFQVIIKELEAVQGLVEVNIGEAKARAELPSVGKMLKSAMSTSAKLAGDRAKPNKTVSIRVPMKLRSDA